MSRARPVAKKRQRARVEQRARTRAARHSGPSLAGERMQWAAALAASSILLVVLRAIFVAMQPRIVGAGATVDPALITPWVRWAVLQTDGIELPVASLGTLLFLGGSSALARFAPVARRRAYVLPVCVLGFLLATLIVVRTRSTDWLPPADPMAGTLLFVVGAALLWIVYLAAKHAGRIWSIIAIGAAGAILTAAVVLSLPGAAVVDYSYYIGPALKHIQGSGLGSFYMQYDLLGTLLIEGMMRARLELHQMQLVLTLILAAWYGLYWLLIRRLFKSRFIGLLLFFALVIVRFLDIQDHPAFTPQVLPHRLDMWVPLVLLCTMWGLDSIKTSVAFASSYALDSTFGFMAAGVYVVALVVQTFSQRAAFGPRSALVRLGIRAVPLVIVAAAQKVVFGSIVSPAASYYLNVKLGFLPITPKSLFWPIALLLGWAVTTFVIHRAERSSRWGLLICLFAVAQLTYFFGRSHDHNLLNVSSAWLFPVFLAIDQARELGAFAAPVGAVLVLVAALIGAHRSEIKLDRIADRLRSGVWLEPHPIEAQVEWYRPVAAPNIMPIDLADAYYNYRLRLPQRGFFAPFNANVFVDQTAIFVDDVLSQGVVPVAIDPLMAQWIGELNRSPALKARGHQFVGYRYGATLIGIRRAPTQ